MRFTLLIDFVPVVYFELEIHLNTLNIYLHLYTYITYRVYGLF